LCKNGCPLSMMSLGHYYFDKEGSEYDKLQSTKAYKYFKKAIKLFKRGTYEGPNEISSAYCNLGTIYSAGTIVKKNYIKAIKNYKKALKEKVYGESHGRAALNLAIFYYKGLGVEINDEKVIAYLKLSISHECTAGEGLTRLGDMYYRGHMRGLHIVKDINRALSLWDKAVNKGCGEAMYMLANFYFKGPENSLDHEKAFKFANMALKHNFIGARLLLAEMYEKGIGVERNSEMQMRLLRQAKVLHWRTLKGNNPESYKDVRRKVCVCAMCKNSGDFNSKRNSSLCKRSKKYRHCG